MRKQVVGLGVAILLVIGTSAQAQSEYGREVGGYLAVAGIAAYDDLSDLGLYGTVNGGVTARAGFRIAAPVGFELQGDWNNLKSWRKDDVWTITTNFRVYPSMMEQFEGTLPDVFQPWVVAGLGIMGGDPTGDPYQINGAFRVGVGLDFYLTEQMALNFGYEWLSGTGFWAERDTRNVLLGVQYNF